MITMNSGCSVTCGALSRELRFASGHSAAVSALGKRAEDPKQPLSLPIQNRRTVTLAPPEPQSLGAKMWQGQDVAHRGNISRVW